MNLTAKSRCQKAVFHNQMHKQVKYTFVFCAVHFN